MSGKKAIPAVYVTEQLRADFGDDADDLAKWFAEWKSWGPAGEYSDWYFGKDGAYTEPRRNGKSVLRHVHLPPSDEDSEEFAKWELNAKRLSRKTSNNVLIYAHDATHGYLLIYFAREPNGHSIAEMKTAASKQLMEQLANVAEAFCHDGSITI